MVKTLKIAFFLFYFPYLINKEIKVVLWAHIEPLLTKKSKVLFSFYSRASTVFMSG